MYVTGQNPESVSSCKISPPRPGQVTGASFRKSHCGMSVLCPLKMQAPFRLGSRSSGQEKTAAQGTGEHGG
jgi:hypothetical protein